MTMRPRAVLFDLFNTLIPGGSRDERDKVSRRMAEMLGVDPDSLAGLIRDTFDDRTRGRLGDLRSTVSWLAHRLGADPSAADVAAAVELRLEMTRSLHEQTWALPALARLRDAGLPCGLVTDCSAETPEIWSESPLSPCFDTLSFSCVTGHRKPEAEAYLTAVRALEVAPSECLYVGDGGSFELSGAQALGMQAVRYLTPTAIRGESIDEEADWTGDVVIDLADLLPIVD